MLFLFHKDRSIHLVVHGDDLTAMRLRADLDWYEERLGQSLEVKIRGRIGEDTTLKTMRILNRIVTLTDEGLVYESDPCHAELMAHLASECVDIVSTGPRASGGILRPAYLAIVRAADNNKDSRSF